MAHGHPHARHYPLSMAWAEAQIVVERLNNDAASNTVLLQLAISAVMSKQGAKLLKDVLKGMTSGQG